MSLSDAYDSLEETDALYPQCKTCRWYSGSPPGDRAFFDDKIDNPKNNMRRLLRACKETGLDVSPSSFRNHLQEHHDHLRAVVA